MTKSVLLPSNTTALEHMLAASGQSLSSLPVPLRDLWNPDTCPEHLLPWLAWTLSIDNWAPYWPVTVKRARLREAVEIQRRKGTTQSVRDVVRSFGAGLALREWWQKSPRGTPHTFEVVLTLGGSVPNTAAYQTDVINEIQRTKPLRSHFTFTAGLSASARLGLAGASRPIVYRRISCTEAE